MLTKPHTYVHTYEELAGLHTKRLMVNFEVDEEAQEHEIDMKTMEVTELFRHAGESSICMFMCVSV